MFINPNFAAYAAYDMFMSVAKANAGLLSAGFAAAAALTPVEEPRRFLNANAVMWGRAAKDFPEPPFDITSATINGKKVAVSEEVVMSRSFGNLIRFNSDTDIYKPKALVIAPMSGHYPSLIRATVQGLLDEGLNVWVTGWANPSEVPMCEGDFGLDEYAEHLESFMTKVGPGTHMVAICQATPLAAAVAASMEEDNSPFAEESITLVAGPLDTRIEPTVVNELAQKNSIEFFQNMITTVPSGYAGAGREVYPGFMQLMAFMSMNPERHIMAHANMFFDLWKGDNAAAEKTMRFYDHYFAVSNMSKKFFLQTVQQVFQEHLLPRGEWYVRGRKVNLGAITKPIFTIEGEKDDICSQGQTEAIHDLCKNSRRHDHRLIPDVGHYGAFGRKATPLIARFIGAVDVDNRLKMAEESPDTGSMPPNFGHIAGGVNQPLAVP